MNSTEGMSQVVEQLPPSQASASAYAFLATICKDFSAVVASKRCLEYALQQTPNSSSYCLNLMHVIELQADSGGGQGQVLQEKKDRPLVCKSYAEALQVCKDKDKDKDKDVDNDIS